MNTKNTTAIATTDQNPGYLTETVNLAELFSEELDGLRPSFERIKIPAGGGLAYEVPGDDPNSPDSAKDFSAVILYHHPINSYYKEKFTGGNNPPTAPAWMVRLASLPRPANAGTARPVRMPSLAAEKTAAWLANRSVACTSCAKVKCFR